MSGALIGGESAPCSKHFAAPVWCRRGLLWKVRTSKLIWTVIAVRASGSVGQCPSCGTVSRRVHSHYRRRVIDLPLSGRIVQLLVIARRFRCDAVLCGRQIFTERFAHLLAPSARRTTRLDSIVHHLGLALGGRPAAGFAKRLMLPVSKDTLLRVIRRRSRPSADPLRSSALMIGPGGAITATPASSATWKGAGLSRCCRIAVGDRASLVRHSFHDHDRRP